MIETHGSLKGPRVLVDEIRVRDNIRGMVEKAHRCGVRLRPHFKTHQSQEIGRWFRQAGVESIAVSSVDQALYFAKDGWDDITLAVPVCLGDVQRLANLAGMVRFGVLVDSLETARFLTRELKAHIRVWIKVDVGYGRVGVRWDRPGAIAEIFDQLTSAKNLEPAGLLTHAGHSYHAANAAEIAQIHTKTLERMTGLADFLEANGPERPQISIGDTPCCSVAKDFDGVAEIRPGNFVFYDAQQLTIGACGESQIAMGVACPVIGVYPDRGEVVLLGGAVHLSKDRFPHPSTGTDIFGWVTNRNKNGFGLIDPRNYLRGVSQEHGMVTVGDTALLSSIRVGDSLVVLPAHACLTANLYRAYQTLEGQELPRRVSAS